MKRKVLSMAILISIGIVAGLAGCKPFTITHIAKGDTKAYVLSFDVKIPKQKNPYRLNGVTYQFVDHGSPANIKIGDSMIIELLLPTGNGVDDELFPYWKLEHSSRNINDIVVVHYTAILVEIQHGENDGLSGG